MSGQSVLEGNARTQDPGLNNQLFCFKADPANFSVYTKIYTLFLCMHWFGIVYRIRPLHGKANRLHLFKLSGKFVVVFINVSGSGLGTW